MGIFLFPIFIICNKALTSFQQLLSRWINDVVHIRKEGQQAMNRDEGSYHAYDRFLDTASSRRVKNQKN